MKSYGAFFREIHAARRLGSKNCRAVAASCGSPLESSEDLSP